MQVRGALWVHLHGATCEARNEVPALPLAEQALAISDCLNTADRYVFDASAETAPLPPGAARNGFNGPLSADRWPSCGEPEGGVVLHAHYLRP